MTILKFPTKHNLQDETLMENIPAKNGISKVKLPISHFSSENILI